MVLLVPNKSDKSGKDSSSTFEKSHKASRGEMVALIGIVLCAALALGILVGRLLGVLDA